MTKPTTYTARLLDFRKESDVKIVALYERPSKGDERQSKDEDSNSIQNKKAQLEEYAKQSGFVNIKHYTEIIISTCFCQLQLDT